MRYPVRRRNRLGSEIVTIPAAAERESAKATKIQRFQECCGKREDIPGEDRSNTLARAGKTYLVRTDLIPKRVPTLVSIPVDLS